jgi:hypothetical protein
VLDPPVVEHARSLSAATPRPKESRLDGVLGMTRQSTRSFAIKLDDGEEVRGVLLDGAEEAPRLRDVGPAVFRPSGRLLRLDARAIIPCAEQSAFWSKLPKAKPTRASHIRQRLPQTATTGVNAFFGRWAAGPVGDDALVELLDAGR